MRFVHGSDHGLARAASEAEVMAIAREYWAAVPKWVRCLVPRKCHRYPLETPPDVHRWASVLDARFGDDVAFGDTQRLRELVDFFRHSSARLHALAAPPVSPPAAPRRESAPAPRDPRSS
ncbi:MAG TPA: hypothetical protein VFJ86_17410 [Usitatibacter sp.]|nr:hypothetical protein [Usitatibacter sp.]